MFKPQRDPKSQQWKIVGERGGVVPKELSGRYTKKYFADTAIAAYESKKVKNDNVQTGTGKRGRKPSGKASTKELRGSGPEDQELVSD